jgi:hypothetical protein
MLWTSGGLGRVGYRTLFSFLGHDDVQEMRDIGVVLLL